MPTSAGYEVVKQNDSVYLGLYNKYFSAFLRFCCFEKVDSKLTAAPISELVQSLVEMLSITVNCFAKSRIRTASSNYKDFIQAFKKLVSNEIVHNAGLSADTDRLWKLMLVNDKDVMN